MTGYFWEPFLASLLAAGVSTTGILAVRRLHSWGRQKTTILACFAAGVLITVSFLHVVPEALGMTPEAPVYLLGGYLFMHFFSRLISDHLCNRPATAEYAIGLVPMVGIGIHSFIDGIIYSVTFAASFFTGALTVTGLIIHELPEGIVTYLLLIHGGFKERTACLLAILSSALTTPFGRFLPRNLCNLASSLQMTSLLRFPRLASSCI